MRWDHSLLVVTLALAGCIFEVPTKFEREAESPQTLKTLARPDSDERHGPKSSREGGS